MAGMTKDQREYALRRLGAAFSAAEAAVKKRYTTPAVVVTDRQRTEMILSGVATLNRSRLEHRGAGYSGDAFHKMFDFPVHPRAAEVDMTAVNRDLTPIKAEYTRLQDELMLGDAVTALSLIRDFETFTQKEE